MIKEEDTLAENMESRTTSVRTAGARPGSSVERKNRARANHVSEPNSIAGKDGGEGLAAVGPRPQAAKMARNRKHLKKDVPIFMQNMKDTSGVGSSKLSGDDIEMGNTVVSSPPTVNMARTCKALYYAPSYMNMMVCAKDGTLNNSNNGSVTIQSYSTNPENMPVGTVGKKCTDKDETPVPMRETRARSKVNKPSCDENNPEQGPSTLDKNQARDVKIEIKEEDDCIQTKLVSRKNMGRRESIKLTPQKANEVNRIRKESVGRDGSSVVTRSCQIKHKNKVVKNEDKVVTQKPFVSKRRIHKRKAKLTSDNENTLSNAKDECMNKGNENVVIPNPSSMKRQTRDATRSSHEASIRKPIENTVKPKPLISKRRMRQRRAKLLAYYKIESTSSSSEDDSNNKNGNKSVTRKPSTMKRRMHQRKAKLSSNYNEDIETTSSSDEECINDKAENVVTPKLLASKQRNHQSNDKLTYSVNKDGYTTADVEAKNEDQLPKPVDMNRGSLDMKRVSDRRKLTRTSTFVNKMTSGNYKMVSNEEDKVETSNNFPSKRQSYRRKQTQRRCPNNGIKDESEEKKRNVLAKNRQSHQCKATSTSYTNEQSLINPEEATSTLEEYVVTALVDTETNGTKNSQDLSAKTPVDTTESQHKNKNALPDNVNEHNSIDSDEKTLTLQDAKTVDATEKNVIKNSQDSSAETSVDTKKIQYGRNALSKDVNKSSCANEGAVVMLDNASTSLESGSIDVVTVPIIDKNTFEEVAGTSVSMRGKSHSYNSKLPSRNLGKIICRKEEIVARSKYIVEPVNPVSTICRKRQHQSTTLLNNTVKSSHTQECNLNTTELDTSTLENGSINAESGGVKDCDATVNTVDNYKDEFLSEPPASAQKDQQQTKSHASTVEKINCPMETTGEKILRPKLNAVDVNIVNDNTNTDCKERYGVLLEPQPTTTTCEYQQETTTIPSKMGTVNVEMGSYINNSCEGASHIEGTYTDIPTISKENRYSGTADSDKKAIEPWNHSPQASPPGTSVCLIEYSTNLYVNNPHQTIADRKDAIDTVDIGTIYVKALRDDVEASVNSQNKLTIPAWNHACNLSLRKREYKKNTSECDTTGTCNNKPEFIVELVYTDVADDGSIHVKIVELEPDVNPGLENTTLYIAKDKVLARKLYERISRLEGDTIDVETVNAESNVNDLANRNDDIKMLYHTPVDKNKGRVATKKQLDTPEKNIQHQTSIEPINLNGITYTIPGERAFGTEDAANDLDIVAILDEKKTVVKTPKSLRLRERKRKERNVTTTWNTSKNGINDPVNCECETEAAVAPTPVQRRRRSQATIKPASSHSNKASVPTLGNTHVENLVRPINTISTRKQETPRMDLGLTDDNVRQENNIEFFTSMEGRIPDYIVTNGAFRTGHGQYSVVDLTGHSSLVRYQNVSECVYNEGSSTTGFHHMKYSRLDTASKSSSNSIHVYTVYAKDKQEANPSSDNTESMLSFNVNAGAYDPAFDIYLNNDEEITTAATLSTNLHFTNLETDFLHTVDIDEVINHDSHFANSTLPLNTALETPRIFSAILETTGHGLDNPSSSQDDPYNPETVITSSTSNAPLENYTQLNGIWDGNVHYVGMTSASTGEVVLSVNDTYIVHPSCSNETRLENGAYFEEIQEPRLNTSDILEIEMDVVGDGVNRNL